MAAEREELARDLDVLLPVLLENSNSREEIVRSEGRALR